MIINFFQNKGSSMSKEIILDDSVMIVSETDEKGNIIYANEDFCNICGYTKEELIGQPHNIVRHEDMPKVAFQDLWSTIKSNKDWRGTVKNKTKSESICLSSTG